MKEYRRLQSRYVGHSISIALTEHLRLQAPGIWWVAIGALAKAAGCRAKPSDILPGKPFARAGDGLSRSIPAADLVLIDEVHRWFGLYGDWLNDSLMGNMSVIGRFAGYVALHLARPSRRP